MKLFNVLGMVKANLQLNMLTIGVNLSDIVLIYGIIKNLSVLSLFIIQTINIVDMKFNFIMNSRKMKYIRRYPFCKNILIASNCFVETSDDTNEKSYPQLHK